MVEPLLIGVVIGVLLVGASAHQLRGGVKQRGYGLALAGAKSTDGRSPSSGPVVVEGIIDGPADGPPLESGYTGRPCVAYLTKKIKRKSPGDVNVHQANNFRERIGEHQEVVPFTVRTDDGGSVRVDATDAIVDAADDDYETVSPRDVMERRGPLAGLWWFARQLSTSADEQVDRTYLEAIFGPGDSVRIFGELRDEDAASGVLTKAADAPLVVTSKSQDAVVDSYRSVANSRLIRGVVLLGIGVVIILAVTGVV